MERNSSSEGTWKDVNDVVKSIISLSKIHNSSKKVEMLDNLNGNNSLGASSNLRNFRPNENNSYGNFSNFDGRSFQGGESSGLGRGQYMASLAAKYSQGERRAELDRAIHEQLLEINGCGYSNDVIEQRFGEPTDYISFLSSAHISSDLSDDLPVSEKEEAVGSEQFEDVLAEEVSQSYGNGCFINSNTLCDARKEVKENAETREPTTDVNIPPPQIQGMKSPSKKAKQRKCRNLVVLNFSGSLNQKKDLKAPDDFLSHSSSFSTVAKNQTDSHQMNNKDCIFQPEDFPAL